MKPTSSAVNKSRRFWRSHRSTFFFLFLMMVFRSAWADWVTVPTGSMNPTIIEGDRVLVDKHVYGVRIPWTLVRISEGRDPARGDIVVFDSPVDGTSLVKRLIGVPGDVVALDDQGLSINGVRASYQDGDVATLDALLSQTLAHAPRVLRESGVGPGHDILLMPDGSPHDSFAPVTVPKDMYLVLGDNRDRSADSRYFGFVPRRNFVGRATRVAISFDPERFYRPRQDRFFESLE